MKILIVNTYDKGGAANACLRLHEGLLSEGIVSKVLLKRKEKALPNTFQFQKAKASKSKFQILTHKVWVALRILGILKTSKQTQAQHFLKQRDSGLELFSFPDSNFDITTSKLYQEADVINLHWVADFLDYESFFKKNKKPVVWTLHDMNPFTGGEHYSETFLGIDHTGHPIHREVSEEEKQIAHQNLSIKLNAIQTSSHMAVVAPSKWLSTAAQESLVFKHKEVHCIPYGINSELFQYRDKDYSRTVLNIPKDKTIILFVADSITNHRKGYAILKKALEMIQHDEVVLCAVGHKESSLESVKNIIELGPIYDERLMSMVYSAADVFVIPSLMDNLPNTVLESLMCGTPVIGFPVGGIIDMINSGQNGLLAKALNSFALSEAIEEFLNIKDTFNSRAIREAAKNKYDLSIQAKAYVKLYERLLAK